MFKPNHQRFLKVKIKCLADESVIIRKEERRARGDLRRDLYLHRIGVVRSESRAALLAYAYLRGRPVESVEKNPRSGYLASRAYTRAHKIVKKFGTFEAFTGFREWATVTAETRA